MKRYGIVRCIDEKVDNGYRFNVLFCLPKEDGKFINFDAYEVVAEDVYQTKQKFKADNGHTAKVYEDPKGNLYAVFCDHSARFLR